MKAKNARKLQKKINGIFFFLLLFRYAGCENKAIALTPTDFSFPVFLVIFSCYQKIMQFDYKYIVIEGSNGSRNVKMQFWGLKTTGCFLKNNIKMFNFHYKILSISKNSNFFIQEVLSIHFLTSPHKPLFDFDECIGKANLGEEEKN